MQNGFTRAALRPDLCPGWYTLCTAPGHQTPDAGSSMGIREMIGVGRPKETHGRDTQKRAPIVEALQTYLDASPVSFDVPGHQSGKAAPHDVKKLLGSQSFAADTTTQKGLDDRGERKRVRQRAERLAARLWRADHCFFSTNGTSLSNHAAMVAVAGPGETVLVARNSHTLELEVTVATPGSTPDGGRAITEAVHLHFLRRA